MKRRWQIWAPTALAFTLVLGIYIGMKLDYGQSAYVLMAPDRQHQKINQLIDYINRDYVDEVDTDSLLDKTIEDILGQLDPHSIYIHRSEFSVVEESMQGNFQGIGVEFELQRDTIVVVSPISGGPSEQLGIEAGDRIVIVDGDTVAGVGLQNRDVIAKLRGEKGSTVDVQIYRTGSSKLLDFTIERDDIPLVSIDVAYMIDDETGYIKLSRFAETSYAEFAQARKDLLERGMKKLVFDLRGNPGGYLHIADRIADEFLADGELIVFTEGRSRERKYYYATSKGELEDMPVVVLIDEGSASASEIIAGALQDNDRAEIIGRRSFGKGLVQEQWELSDGSALRLSVARYYTPTGRCIQRPYTDYCEAYYLESFHDDYDEVVEVDTSEMKEEIEELVFTTPGGDTVYGGGGIMPDVLIPVDTAGRTRWFYEVLSYGNLRKFSFEYADSHREDLKAKYVAAAEFSHSFELPDEVYQDYLNQVKEGGAQTEWGRNERSEFLVRTRIKAMIGRQIWGTEAFYPVIHQTDYTLEAATKALK